MIRIHLPGSGLLAAAAIAGAAAAIAGADTVTVDLDEPTLDRWFYPFNSNPGAKPDAPIFGGITDQDAGFDPAFDNRDGQLLVGFDTSGQVTPGLGVEHYQVRSAVVTVMIKNDMAFGYDPTRDSWETWLPGAEDPDPGRPVELFAAGFRHGFSAATFPEDGPFCDGCSCFPPAICKRVRTAFPVELIGSGCSGIDVSNFVDDMFDPEPLAVGQIEGLAQGEPVPARSEMRFVLDMSSECARTYVARGLDDGIMDFLVASVFVAAEQQAGDFPEVFCKEDLLVVLDPEVFAARLDLLVDVGPLGDFDGDGAVDTVDFLQLLAAWGPCEGPCPPLCQEDLNGDCVVDTVDFLALLANWG